MKWQKSKMLYDFQQIFYLHHLFVSLWKCDCYIHISITGYTKLYQRHSLTSLQIESYITYCVLFLTYYLHNRAYWKSVVAAVPCTGRWNKGHLLPRPRCQSVQRCSYWEALNIHTHGTEISDNAEITNIVSQKQFGTDGHRQGSRILARRTRCCS